MASDDPHLGVEPGRASAEADALRAQIRLIEQQLAVSFDHAPIGMSLVDHDDRMVRVNAALCRLMGRSEDELLQRTWQEMTHPDDQSVGAHEIAQLFAGERDSIAVEKRYVRGDGRAVWVQVNVSLIRDDDGTPLFRLTQHVDIDRRRGREEQLAQLAAAERAAADELRRVDEIKTAFLDAVSHELRTPVTVVRGMAETLQHHRARLAPAARERLEDALVEQSRRLAGLLEDLLDVERLRNGRGLLRPEPTEIIALVRTAVEASAARARVQLATPPVLWFRTDPRRLTLIVENLLSNAAKYAPTGPVQVRVSVTPASSRPDAPARSRPGIPAQSSTDTPVGSKTTTAPRAGATTPPGPAAPDTGGTSTADQPVLRIEVIDHGPGIAPDAHEEIFEPFFRAAPDHPKPGTGVGLSLVARFARLHGGTAYVADREQGAHLVVELAELREQDPARPDPTDARAGSGSDQPRIAIRPSP